MAELTVKTEQGYLRGKIDQDYQGKDFYAFQGIPYAKPPVGNLRFKAPRPPENWIGIRDATEEGSECYSVHMLHLQIIGSEDCLYLNVYTPELPTSANLPLKPVMVWIHGGSFVSGSGNGEFYGPHFIITQDVVVVTINYRLGVLGFLSLEDPALEVPGNAGLKDQVMALKWVRQNIRNFGGDPNNVTIFGESAGAACVHCLMLSPMARGLFHKCIIQSGCMLNLWARGRGVGPEIADIFEFKYKDERELLNFLQDLPVDKLYKAQLAIKDSFRVDLNRPTGPVVEKISPYEPAFLAEEPLDIILQGKYNKVPFIIGYTDQEGMLHDLIRLNENKLITNFEECVPYTLNLPKGSHVSKFVAKRIKDFYYGKEEPSLENKHILYQLQSDNFFIRDTLRTVKIHAATSSDPIYLYRFSFSGELNMYKRLGNITLPGACHADDLGYLFKMYVTEHIDPKSIEAKIIQRMVKFWTNFARSGNPNSQQIDDIIDVVWKPVKKGEMNFLDINSNLKPGINPENERMLFWEEIYTLQPTHSKL